MLLLPLSLTRSSPCYLWLLTLENLKHIEGMVIEEEEALVAEAKAIEAIYMEIEGVLH
jgi:hypothetical protein